MEHAVDGDRITADAYAVVIDDRDAADFRLLHDLEVDFLGSLVHGWLCYFESIRLMARYQSLLLPHNHHIRLPLVEPVEAPRVEHLPLDRLQSVLALPNIHTRLQWPGLAARKPEVLLLHDTDSLALFEFRCHF